MAFDSIIFDLDRTLWDSRAPIVESWNEVLIRRGMRRVKLKSLNACMGLPIDEIGARLFPELSAVEQKELMEKLIENENKRLYADLEGVLKELKESFLLYIVDNSQKECIKAFLEAHELKEYFAGVGGSIDELIQKYNVKKPVCVGGSDDNANAAARAGIPFIGFGRGNDSKCIGKIKNFGELCDIRVVGKNATVKDILEWKTDSNKIPASVEAVNQLAMGSLGWEHQDVLYSFLGIYTVGVWAYNKDEFPERFKVGTNKIYILKNECEKQEQGEIFDYFRILNSQNFLLEIQEKNPRGYKLVELNKKLEEFCRVYFEAGNLIPMWPGGNTLKGFQNNAYMDFAEIFFGIESRWYDILKANYPEARLDIFENNNKMSKSLSEFLKKVDSPEKYNEYIDEIVSTIKERTEKIKEYIKQNCTK